MSEKQNIRTLSLIQIEQFLAANNEKQYRAKQIFEWLWLKHATTFDAMSNIPKSSREILNNNFYINQTTINTILKSSDRTIKVSFLLHDNNLIEGVLIPDKDRVTACISSQVGCALNCQFCATGQAGFKRDLGYDEIFDELMLLNELSVTHYAIRITHYVYMGMGEPLLNYDNVLKSIQVLSTGSPFPTPSFQLPTPNSQLPTHLVSPKRITLSTVGIPAGIRRLADDNVKFNLAISLHTANNTKRTRIAPINKKHPLSELSDAIKYFHNKTHSRITYEYLLLKDINDSLVDASELADFCKISPCKINLIEYNNNDLPGFQKSDSYKTNAFAEYLQKLNMVVNIRKSRGKDIKAACGQLANASIESKI